MSVQVSACLVANVWCAVFSVWDFRRLVSESSLGTFSLAVIGCNLWHPLSFTMECVNTHLSNFNAVPLLHGVSLRKL